MSDLCKVNVDAVRQVFNDGNHNAFTDLCRFKDALYLTFRTCPDGHGVHPTSSIRVLSSQDGIEWVPVCQFGVPDRDTRDPHFLVFGDRLFVYTGTWFCPKGEPTRLDINDHLGYGAWTDDGASWQGPTSLEGTYGHYIWRAAAYAGKAYLCGRRKRDFVHCAERSEGGPMTESALLESDDGLAWKFRGLFQETFGDETAFLFEDDGSILAVARSLGGNPAQVCRSCPPYRQWRHVDLDRPIGGPLLAKWGERYLVGGRHSTTDRGPKTTLYWLVDDRLVEIAEFPSGGDNSYPGFVQMAEDKALLSYYSSHEGSGTSMPPSAIYLAELSRA